MCERNKVTILDSCHELGALVLDDKVKGPSACLVVLGIEVDNVHRVIHLPDAKVREYQQAINEWKAHRAVTLRDIDSLLGKLFFASRMVQQGRTFLRRLVDLHSRVSRTIRTFRVDDGAYGDILVAAFSIQMELSVSYPSNELDVCGGTGLIYGRVWCLRVWSRLRHCVVQRFLVCPDQASQRIRLVRVRTWLFARNFLWHQIPASVETLAFL